VPQECNVKSTNQQSSLMMNQETPIKGREFLPESINISTYELHNLLG